MMVNYPDFFKELGFKTTYYNTETKTFDQEAIIKSIESIQEHWRAKYTDMKFATDKLKFDNMMTFNQSFTSEIEFLNLETK
jgi:hypothetical protein